MSDKNKVLKKKLKKLKKLQAAIKELKSAIAQNGKSPAKKAVKKKTAPAAATKPQLPPAESMQSPVRIAASRQN
jgi:predicted ribonuclease toxin of YeeF-YezG toxin-antitoxin module